MEPLEQYLPYALRQFETDVIVPLHALGIDASFTTSSLAKLTTVIVVTLFFWLAMRKGSMVPGRLQASAEMIYAFVADTVTRVAGPEAKPSIPFIFTLFIFIWFGTLIGLTPVKDTFTSHLVVMLALSTTVFVYVNVVAFRKHGMGFFRYFLPADIPLFVAPIFVLVETVSYLFRPITLGFRVFANIVAGHIMLKLFADICTMMVGALGPVGAIASIAPVLMIAILYAFEIMIVSIQSYIFMLITSMYLRDALHKH
ncbi:MAG: F0F1 ATP synthase subunit A [Dongiaceae bacterium]